MAGFGNFAGGLMSGYLAMAANQRADDEAQMKKDTLELAKQRQAQEQKAWDEQNAKDSALAVAGQAPVTGFKVGDDTYSTIDQANAEAVKRNDAQRAATGMKDVDNTPITPVTGEVPTQAQIYKKAAEIMNAKGYGLQASAINEQYTKSRKEALLDKLSMGDVQGALKSYNDDVPDGFHAHMLKTVDKNGNPVLALARGPEGADTSKWQVVKEFKDEPEAVAYLSEQVKGTPINYLKVANDAELKKSLMGSREKIAAGHDQTKLDVGAGHDDARVDAAILRGGGAAGSRGAGGAGGAAGGFYANPLGIKDQKGVDDFLDSQLGKVADTDLQFQGADGKPVQISKSEIRPKITTAFEDIVASNPGIRPGQAAQAAIELARYQITGKPVPSDPNFSKETGKWVETAVLGGRRLQVGGTLSADQAIARAPADKKQEMQSVQDSYDIEQANLHAYLESNPDMLKRYLSADPRRSLKKFQEEKAYYDNRASKARDREDTAGEDMRDARMAQTIGGQEPPAKTVPQPTTINSPERAAALGVKAPPTSPDYAGAASKVTSALSQMGSDMQSNWFKNTLPMLKNRNIQQADAMQMVTLLQSNPALRNALTPDDLEAVQLAAGRRI